MKKITYSILVAALALVACNKEKPQVTIPDDQKERISFSMSDGTAGTKAGFTGATTRIVARFQSDENVTSSPRTWYTKAALKAAKDNTTDATALQTSYSTVSYYDGNTRYWDDAFGRKGKISVYAVAIPNSEDATKLTFEKIAGGSTWAAEATPNNSIEWDVTNGTQTSATLTAEDLVYSNNIQSTGKNGRYVWDYTTSPEGYPADNGRLDGHKDGQLVFTQKGGAAESDAGHFDKGHMVFNHSLSRLNITLIEGEGFNSESEDDFKFTYASGSENKNVKLIDLPTAGKLDIATGVWTITASNGVKTMIGSTNAAAGSYSAQVLPTYKFYEDGNANVMTFVIDNNQYYVTQGQIFTALNTTDNTTGTNPKVIVKTDGSSKNYIEMEQGKNYMLSITVKKTKIDNVTASLAPWVEVSGSTSVDNAHIEFSLKTTGATCDKDIDLYRLEDVNNSYNPDSYDFTYKGYNWFGNYTVDANHKTTLSQTAKQGTSEPYYWTTPWYFDSNKIYYHFRTVNSGTVVKGNTDTTNDYFEIEAGSQSSTDPHWGAPMMEVSGQTWLKYSETEGYKDHLHWAIGATGSQIKVQELHMMSNINVVLQTNNDGSKVTLYDNTTDSLNPKGAVVKITRMAKKGTVEMGRGLVTPVAPTSYDSADAEFKMDSPATTSADTYFSESGKANQTQTKPFTAAAVPQSLSRNFSSESDTDYVGIFIQTPDNNQYYVVKKLSEILATSVSDQRDQTINQKIQRWYPGHTYTYTFTISKKGIENITCTVADWVNVTGKDTAIDLES